MKWKSYLLFFVLTATVLSVGFITGSASAAGCFTDVGGHWAETFICWLKDNGISSGYPDGSYTPNSSITRGEMAVMLQKINNLAASQDAANLTSAKAYTDSQTTGGITINASSQAWSENNNSAASVYYNYIYSAFLTTTGGFNYSFYANIPVPTSMFGKKMYLDGGKICYDAKYGAYINSISIIHIQGTTGNQNIYTDLSDRYDEACVKMNLSNPVALSADDSIILYMTVFFPFASDELRVLSSALYLHPSLTDEPAIGSAPDHTVTLEPAADLP